MEYEYDDSFEHQAHELDEELDDDGSKREGPAPGTTARTDELAEQHKQWRKVRKRRRSRDDVHPVAARAVDRARRGGAPLPAALRRQLEAATGADLSDVVLHTGDAAQKAATAVGAKAFTQGKDVFFGDGQFDPTSKTGRHLIAHEVAHTAQASAGAAATSKVSSPGAAHEGQADSFADAFAAGGAAAARAMPLSRGSVAPTMLSRVTEAARRRARVGREALEAEIDHAASGSDRSQALAAIKRAIGAAAAHGPDADELLTVELEGDRIFPILEDDAQPLMRRCAQANDRAARQESSETPADGQSDARGGGQETEGTEDSSSGRGGGSGQQQQQPGEGGGQRQQGEQENEDEDGAAADPNELEQTHQRITGHWESTDSHDATLQLSQAGTHFHGRYQIRQRDPDDGFSLNPNQMGNMRLNGGTIEGEATSDTEEATEFRFSGNPTTGNTGDPFNGTIRLRRDGKLILSLADGSTFRLQRSPYGGERGALSEDVVSGLDQEGQEGIMQPFGRHQRELLDSTAERISGICRRHAASGVNPVSNADNAREIESQVSTLRDEIPEVQHAQARDNLRRQLFLRQASEDMTCLEMTRVITHAYESQTNVARAFLQLEGPGAADAGDPPYRYRIMWVLLGGDVELGLEGGIHVGRMKIEEGRLPDPEGDAGSDNWSTLHQGQVNFLRGTIGIGASAGFNVGEWSGWKYSVETNNHWRMEDFSPGTFVCGGGGASASVGGTAALSGSSMWIRGNAGFPPLQFLDTDTGISADVVLGAGAGAGVTGQGGVIVSDASLTGGDGDQGTREVEEGRTSRIEAVQIAMQDFVGFETDIDQPNEEARGRLRQFCAENQALLNAAGTTVEIHGYASRLGDEDYNQDLSQRRANNIRSAMNAMLNQQHSWSATGHGERDAHAAGMPEHDDSAEWRRVDVFVDGVLLLRLRSRNPNTRRPSTGLPPADMDFTQEEAFGNQPPADMNFTEEEAYGGQNVQQKSRGGGPTDAGSIHGAADRATGGSRGALPFRAQIQRSFGAHDVSGIGAFLGGPTEGALDDMGAEAFARGENVALRSGSSLHTVAHEAAHVVQQRRGVSLSGGVGKAGDSYEQDADAIADRVVRGKNAEDLLGPQPSNAVASEGAVQRRDGDDDRFGEHDHDHDHEHDEHEHGEQTEIDSIRFSDDDAMARLAVEDIILREGSTGAAVIRVQQALIDLGHLSAADTTMGTFDAATTAAVVAYQRSSGAVVDGIVGDETFGKLDQRFVDHSVEGEILDRTTTANRLDGTRALTTGEVDAFNEAISTGVRADPVTGRLPDFQETVDGQTYGARVEAEITRIVDIYLARAQEAQRDRAAGHLYDWGDINNVGVESKRATDNSFDAYNTGPALSGGTASSVIQDAWNTKEQELAADPAVADAWAEWRVRKIITGSGGVHRIDERHGAVQSRTAEAGILDALKARIATDRRDDLVLIHKNWPAFATPSTGQVHIQIIQDVDSSGTLPNEEGRDYMWDLFQTLIHEYLHTLEHGDHVAYRGGLDAHEGGFTLREGTTDYFTKIAYNNFTITDATRRAVEGPFHEAGVTHDLPTLHTYRQSQNAERGAGVVGLPNLCAAFFLGRTDLIGGP